MVKNSLNFNSLVFSQACQWYTIVAIVGSITSKLINWASEANPTLGCSIEISRDIYIYVHVSVVVQKA